MWRGWWVLGMLSLVSCGDDAAADGPSNTPRGGTSSGRGSTGGMAAGGSSSTSGGTSSAGQSAGGTVAGGSALGGGGGTSSAGVSGGGTGATGGFTPIAGQSSGGAGGRSGSAGGPGGAAGDTDEVGTGGDADSAGGASGGDAPSGVATICLGDGCPFGECDDAGFFAEAACSGVYPGPLDENSIYCASGGDGTYCLVGDPDDIWSVSCVDGVALLTDCMNAGCRLDAGIAACD